MLIGLHPGATQIILPDGTPAYQGIGAPKALLEAPKGGSNIVIGIGLYTSGNNRRAVAALWKAGSNSMMNDVRFLGGHGTPLPDGSRENPYNSSHTADPDPNRHWDSQYPSLWVTDGGGGTFLDIWTPSTFAQAGMMVSDTETEGRAYQISSEHHVRNELKVRNAAHWSFYALQTEEERGESGFALPIEIDSSHDITFANFHSYRVISSFQPFPWAVKVSNSRDIRFRNFHCDSNSKASFDSAIYDQSHDVELRQHEFAWLDISGQAPRPKPVKLSLVAARGAKAGKAGGWIFQHLRRRGWTTWRFLLCGCALAADLSLGYCVAATFHRQRLSAGTGQSGRGSGGKSHGHFLRGQWRGLCTHFRRPGHAA